MFTGMGTGTEDGDRDEGVGKRWGRNAGKLPVLNVAFPVSIVTTISTSVPTQ